METKEANEFINQIKISNVYTPERYKLNLECVQELLEEGEKYKKIVEEIKEIHTKVDEYTQTKYVVSIVEKIEQKYFPKEVIK